MANTTSSIPCPHPFLPFVDYPYKGGFNDSRFCQAVPGLPELVCCLPCPVTDWIYPDNFNNIALATNWMSLGAFLCCLFLLLSFLFLPVAKTSRHYLTIGLVMGVGLLSLSFMVPLWAKPNECFDPITANDMYSNLACAWSGALVIFGGLASVMWIFNRSLSLHLQICWQMTMGKKFLYCTHALAWGVTALLGGVSLGVSGVSYRFGKVCHINHENSTATFWGPILGFAVLAAILQITTFAFCIKVYLRNLWDPHTTSAASSSMPSALPSTTASSIKPKSARATYRRVRKVIALQWRGSVVVMILLVSAVYFAVVFQVFDNLSQKAINEPQTTQDWVLCLVGAQGNKEPCLDFAGELSVSEPIVLAVLFLLSLMGYWCLLFLGRLSMFAGWWEIIRQPFRVRDHFVSYDARRISDPRNYEMLTSPPQSYHMIKGPQGGLVASAKPAGFDMIDPSNSYALDALKIKEWSANATSDSPADDSPAESFPSTRYNSNAHVQSFSKPRPPARTHSQQGHVSFSQDDAIESSTQTATSGEGWPIAVSRPSPTYVSPRRETFTTAAGATAPSADPYQHPERNASALSQNSTTNLRPGSPMGNNGRSASALGRDWRTPPSAFGAGWVPQRNNSRSGALGGAPSIRDWDPTSTYAR